jgi:putative peptide zinc metalloprotease protein
MRRLTLFLAPILLALALAWPGIASAQDNTAIAVNTKDGTTLFKVSFKIVRANQDVVDNGNAAVAISSCTDCQSIAAAYEIVLVFSDPSVVSPVNLALAENVDCQTCVAFAAASQWLLGTGGPVHFTAEGNQLLAGIKQRLNDLSKQDGLTLEELQAALDQIAGDIVGVLTHQLVPSGNSGSHDQKDDETTTATTTEPTDTGTDTGTGIQTDTVPTDTTASEPTTTEGPTTTDGSTTTSP